MVDVQTLTTMFGGIGVGVAAIYYILTLRNSQKTQELALKAQQQTLETRQAQMFMNIYDKTSSKEFQTAWQRVVMTPWSTYKEFMELNKQPEFMEASSTVGMFYEGLGVLVKEGLIDIRFVALLICGMTRAYWEKFLPILGDGRRSAGFSRWYSEADYLYWELLRYLKEHPELDTRIEKPYG